MSWVTLTKYFRIGLVDAYRWDGTPQGAAQLVMRYPSRVEVHGDYLLLRCPGEGCMMVDPGDWLVNVVDEKSGHVVREAVYAQEYEPVEARWRRIDHHWGFVWEHSCEQLGLLMHEGSNPPWELLPSRGAIQQRDTIVGIGEIIIGVPSAHMWWPLRDPHQWKPTGEVMEHTVW